jgi:hypothetical protein
MLVSWVQKQRVLKFVCLLSKYEYLIIKIDEQPFDGLVADRIVFLCN